MDLLCKDDPEQDQIRRELEQMAGRSRDMIVFGIRFEKRKPVLTEVGSGINGTHVGIRGNSPVKGNSGDFDPIDSDSDIYIGFTEGYVNGPVSDLDAPSEDVGLNNGDNDVQRRSQ
ncbi:uncharacterized protein CTRU02_212529 [Colletotrichum truncatum]|uniref:Uncharacterized protein n=1 Tax=Colletotrichum truncatum TaxID=5467 RepID=A0ACC3YNW3_COLTU